MAGPLANAAALEHRQLFSLSFREWLLLVLLRFTHMYL